MSSRVIRIRGMSRVVALCFSLVLSTSSTLADDLIKVASHTGSTELFGLEPCCDLCPAAYEESSYDTKYLGFFKTLVQGDDDWLFRTENDLRTEFGTSEMGYAGLSRFRQALLSKGVELVVVYQPTRGLVNYSKLPEDIQQDFNFELASHNYEVALDRFRDLGIWVPDFTKLLDEREDKAFFFRGDHHWTPYGAKRAAAVTARTIAQIPSFPLIERKLYATHYDGLMGKRGTLHRAATKICGNDYADQFVESFVTEPVEEETNLFGEESLPEIVLLGTSNSQKAYNFGGFLSEKLNVEIYNAAVTGGGIAGAFLQYLPNEDFQQSPPKVLIWEFETHYNLAKSMLFRQLVPLVNNGCEGRTALLDQTSILTSGKNEVLLNGGDDGVQTIKGPDYVIDLTYSDPKIRDLEGTIWYMNGRKEKIKIDVSSYVDNQARFVFELKNDPLVNDVTFLGLDLKLTEGIPEGTQVRAKVCAMSEQVVADNSSVD